LALIRENTLGRRRVLQGAAAFGGFGLLGGCATAAADGRSELQAFSPTLVIPPIRAEIRRIFDVTVCLRPFRAAGPRLDAEQVGDKLVVHNYGHGGSGWSLSWGSGTVAVRKAMAGSPSEIAVIGCGALGLSAAILAQHAGAKVTIYARDLLPDTPSARATGSWTPSSRIALADSVSPEFPDLWEEMARTSYRTFRRYLGLPGNPIEWMDRYIVTDNSPRPPAPPLPVSYQFADYGARLRDITPGIERMSPGETPFPAGASVRRHATMTFNIAAYGHALMSEFLAAGGKVVRMVFQSPADIARLREPVVINCPGYGARDLWRDESVMPVRGQMAWLVPQPEVRYALFYNGVNVVPRSDGIGVQTLIGGDMRGYGNASETPDPAEAETAVMSLAGLFARMR